MIRVFFGPTVLPGIAVFLFIYQVDSSSCEIIEVEVTNLVWRHWNLESEIRHLKARMTKEGRIVKGKY